MQLEKTLVATRFAGAAIVAALCVASSNVSATQSAATPSAAALQTPPAPTPPAAKPVQTPPVPAAKPATPADPESQAYDAADALKKKAAYAEAAAAFELFVKTYPSSTRAADALVEDGVCWFSIAKSRQKLQQNNPASLDAFGKALAAFDSVLKDHSTSSATGRAQFMRGQVKFFSGDLKAAEAEFTLVIDKHADDPKYGPKGLERRACVRRSLLHAKDALADLQVYVKQYPKSDDMESVSRYLTYTQQFEKPAPALDIEAWIQGDPTTLEALRGEVVMLYFFATWCPHCEEARPFLLDLVDRYEPMGVHFIGIVGHSQNQTVESVRPWLPANKLHFPVFMDRGRTSSNYLGQKIPDAVILDRAGHVRWHDNPALLQYVTLEALLMDDGGANGPKPPPAPSAGKTGASQSK